MSGSNSPSPAISGANTPNRFAAQNATIDDLAKPVSEGLVTLQDYRKRRLEAIEQKKMGKLGSPASGASTPGTMTPTLQPKKKVKKNVAKGKLSFGLDDEDDDTSGLSAAPTPRSTSKTPDDRTPNEDCSDTNTTLLPKKKLGPRSGVTFIPKARTKAALLQEAQTREKLRKEFLVMQEAVKNTEMMIPFVFYDGTNTPGGVCKVKKGDHIWLFLDKARKVGAELGVGGDKGRREWARVSVDDLMLVKGEVIIPHHYEFHYFIVNRTIGFTGPLFPYSPEPTAATPTISINEEIDLSTYNPISTPGKKEAPKPIVPDEELEGYNDDPGLTKVVDRRWYERNKHIFPASVWEEFDPTKDYSKGIRKDQEGNSFFFS
ncbi:XAP5-domain-containing protein [Tothia fuscella]|uniref:XAP5-domain-containing protein n=1 Tax=Tothia fuscella TaxID=1048955 RepID=A0A9P4NN22_9PEZI|nr:XAP5-domain-containing protein [Tothia fuscella]